LGWINALAIYFIIWWTVLFAILPIGIRSQRDENDVVLGTEPGAPATFSFARKAFWTTVAATLAFIAYYTTTQIFGFGLDSIPNLVPDGSKNW
jgi:predicted secreted protein